jgi:hypothetical protein
MKENSLFAFQNGNIDPDESLNYFHPNVTKEDAVEKFYTVKPAHVVTFFLSCYRTCHMN